MVPIVENSTLPLVHHEKASMARALVLHPYNMLLSSPSVTKSYPMESPIQCDRYLFGLLIVFAADSLGILCSIEPCEMVVSVAPARTYGPGSIADERATSTGKIDTQSIWSATYSDPSMQGERRDAWDVARDRLLEFSNTDFFQTG